MLNTCNFMGNLVADPKYFEGENPRVVFTLAVDRDYLGEEGEKTSDFFEFVCWKSTADFVMKYFRKGDRMVVCNAKARVRLYTNSDGEQRRTVQFVDGKVYFAGQKKREDEE